MAATVASGCRALGKSQAAPTSMLPDAPETIPPSTTVVTMPPPTTPTVKAGAPARVYTHALQPTQQIALTIDDGYCQPCVEGYVQFASESGIHLTFSPNGMYQDIWNPVASKLRPLIEVGQVQIANHTFNHSDLTKLSNSGISEQIEKNDAWIESTFGISSRPWFRPPYGYRNSRTDSAAAALGYSNILMWDGTFGDATLLTPGELMAEARQWLQPGTILLGHANHPTVTELFGQIQALISERNLDPVTLNEMFATSATG